MDFVNDPANLRLPVNGLKQTASGGRRHDVVGNALHLHFGTGEEGVVAGDFKMDSVIHAALIALEVNAK